MAWECPNCGHIHPDYYPDCPICGTEIEKAVYEGKIIR